MKAYGFREGIEGLIEIENTKEAFEQFVGGELEKTYITDELILFADLKCEDDYKARVVWVEENKVKYVFFGNCLVSRYDENEYLFDITDSDINIIQEKLKPIVIMLGTNIYVGR